MSRTDHQHNGQGHSGWVALDIAVIVAIGVVLILGSEYLWGWYVRERIAAGARSVLRRRPAAPAEADKPAE